MRLICGDGGEGAASAPFGDSEPAAWLVAIDGLCWVSSLLDWVLDLLKKRWRECRRGDGVFEVLAAAEQSISAGTGSGKDWGWSRGLREKEDLNKAAGLVRGLVLGLFWSSGVLGLA